MSLFPSPALVALGFLRGLVESGSVRFSSLRLDDRSAVRLLHDRGLVEFEGPCVLIAPAGRAVLRAADEAAARSLVALPVSHAPVDAVVPWRPRWSWSWC